MNRIRDEWFWDKRQVIIGVITAMLIIASVTLLAIAIALAYPG